MKMEEKQNFRRRQKTITKFQGYSKRNSGKTMRKLSSRCYYAADGDRSKNQICSQRVQDYDLDKTGRKANLVKRIKNRALDTAVLASLIKTVGIHG